MKAPELWDAVDRDGRPQPALTAKQRPTEVGRCFFLFSLVFFPGGDAAPDMPLGFVDLQYFFYL